jgi:hypothetical protein
MSPASSEIHVDNSTGAMFEKGARITQWHPVPIPDCWQPQRPGPSSEPRDGGFRLLTAFPLRNWPQRMKRWSSRSSLPLPYRFVSNISDLDEDIYKVRPTHRRASTPDLDRSRAKLQLTCSVF